MSFQACLLLLYLQQSGNSVRRRFCSHCGVDVHPLARVLAGDHQTHLCIPCLCWWHPWVSLSVSHPLKTERGPLRPMLCSLALLLKSFHHFFATTWHTHPQSAEPAVPAVRTDSVLLVRSYWSIVHLQTPLEYAVTFESCCGYGSSLLFLCWFPPGCLDFLHRTNKTYYERSDDTWQSPYVTGRACKYPLLRTVSSRYFYNYCECSANIGSILIHVWFNGVFQSKSEWPNWWEQSSKWLVHPWCRSWKLLSEGKHDEYRPTFHWMWYLNEFFFLSIRIFKLNT